VECPTSVGDGTGGDGEQINEALQVDLLVCTRCGQRMTTIAFLTDRLSIRRIRDNLGLGVSEQAKPPPIREILRVAEHGEDCLRAV